MGAGQHGFSTAAAFSLPRRPCPGLRCPQRGRGTFMPTQWGTFALPSASTKKTPCILDAAASVHPSRAAVVVCPRCRTCRLEARPAPAPASSPPSRYAQRRHGRGPVAHHHFVLLSRRPKILPSTRQPQPPPPHHGYRRHRRRRRSRASRARQPSAPRCQVAAQAAAVVNGEATPRRRSTAKAVLPRPGPGAAGGGPARPGLPSPRSAHRHAPALNPAPPAIPGTVSLAALIKSSAASLRGSRFTLPGGPRRQAGQASSRPASELAKSGKAVYLPGTTASHNPATPAPARSPASPPSRMSYELSSPPGRPRQGQAGRRLVQHQHRLRRPPRRVRPWPRAQAGERQVRSQRQPAAIRSRPATGGAAAAVRRAAIYARIRPATVMGCPGHGKGCLRLIQQRGGYPAGLGGRNLALYRQAPSTNGGRPCASRRVSRPPSWSTRRSALPSPAVWVVQCWRHARCRLRHRGSGRDPPVHGQRAHQRTYPRVGGTR